MSEAMPTNCISCGALLHGSYCHACGEKLVGRSDLTLCRYLTELLSELLDADGRFFKTIATLVARPGRLTVDHLQGRRRPCLGPVAVFLLMNVVFFSAAAVEHQHVQQGAAQPDELVRLQRLGEGTCRRKGGGDQTRLR